MKESYNKNAYRNFFEGEFTWLNGFLRNVRRFSNKEAVYCPETDTTLTYSMLNIDTNKLANTFLNDSINYGDVVMYQLYNSIEFVYCYIATQKIGAISCPINFRLSSGETAMTIDDSKPKVFIYDIREKDMVCKALKMAKHKPDIILSVDIKNRNSSEFYNYFIKGNEDTPILNKPFNMYDEVTRLYTSGTTGKPKGVPIASIHEVLTSHDVMMNFPLNCTDTTMNTTPWFHRGGLHAGGPTPTLYAGGKLIIMSKFNAKSCLEYTQKYKITFLIGVPAVLNMLTAQQEIDNIDLSSLKGIITMGSPLEKNACANFMKVLTPNIFNGYGTTETFWNTFLSPYDLPQMAGSAGKACVDDDVRVVKIFDDRRAEADETVAQDLKEVGEIIIKATAKSAYSYFNNDEETATKFHNGYIYTNDLGVWDENSYISVMGRKDDMIISAGENIYPVQVEEILNNHPKVADCIVTAVPDKSRGEAVTAYIIASDDTLTVEELEKYCLNSPMMSRYKRPRYYKFTDNIPLNATGKKQHYIIKQTATEDFKNNLLIKVKG